MTVEFKAFTAYEVEIRLDPGAQIAAAKALLGQDPARVWSLTQTGPAQLKLSTPNLGYIQDLITKFEADWAAKQQPKPAPVAPVAPPPVVVPEPAPAPVVEKAPEGEKVPEAPAAEPEA